MEPNDRKNLIDLLLTIEEINLPGGRGCKEILKSANLEQFISRIDFSGSSSIVTGNLIGILYNHGLINNEETAIELFLIAVKPYTGEDQKRFIDTLIAKYRVKKANTTWNEPSPRKQNSNYPELQTLLEKKRWKDADEETLGILLGLARQRNESVLTEQDIQYLRNQDAEQKLKEIDSLWTNYSNGCFGFKIQKQIYLKSRDFNEFSYKVEWRKTPGLLGGLFNWKTYDELNFTLSAAKGHLPFLVYRDTVVTSVGSRLGMLSDKLISLCIRNIDFG